MPRQVGATLLGIALLVGAALAPPPAAAQEFAPALPTLEVLLDDPTGFIGQTVVLQGQVTDVMAGQAFTVTDDDSHARILVVSAPTPNMRPDRWTGPWARDWKPGDWVTLVGRVGTFRVTEYEEAYDVNVTHDFFHSWEGQVAIFAQLVDVVNPTALQRR
jgi:hypothetical protein